MSQAPPSVRDFVWRSFGEIGAMDLYVLLRLRGDVFVVEQRCAYADIDGRDPEALHLMVRRHDGELSGCLRIFGPDARGGPARIGRVATATADRGQGLGGWMMNEALDEIRERWGQGPIEIGAQVEAIRFYAGLGFVRVSDDYDEDGIMHCTMLRDSSLAG